MAEMHVPNQEGLVEIYQRRARHYDLYARLFPLAGMRVPTYRRQAVHALKLEAGDTVVEVGCGTGLNFPLLEGAVGPTGRIVGVDLTDAMLAQARERVRAHGWQNVRLVQSDAAAFQFPPDLDGILSTFALTLVPDYDRVILNGCRALKVGKRWVVADFKMPSGALSKMAPLLAKLFVQPFGGNVSMANRHPWESMNKYLEDVSMNESYLGMVYVAVGERGESGCRGE